MSDRTNLYFPLWIDGGLSPELRAGARAIRDRLAPDLRFHEIQVDDDCDPAFEHGILGYRAIVRHLRRCDQALESLGPERSLSIGGGCGIDLPIVSWLRARHPGLKLLWLDAHGDLNSPATSPSGHFHGMPLRFLLEGGLDEAIGAPQAALRPDEVALVGGRDLDPPESEFIGRLGIRHLRAEELAAEPRAAASFAAGSPVYVHLDLDVLDPAEYPNVKCPAPGGLSIAAVAELLRGVRSAGRLVGMSLLENLATEPATLARLEPIFDLAREL